MHTNLKICARCTVVVIAGVVWFQCSHAPIDAIGTDDDHHSEAEILQAIVEPTVRAITTTNMTITPNTGTLSLSIAQ